MTKVRKDYGSPATEIGPRRVRVQCSSAAEDRAGEIVEQAGLKYAPSVPVLWNHDPTLPVGRAYPVMLDGNLHAEVEFAPEGVSPKADEVCGLVKSGIVDTVSIGFQPIDAEPLPGANVKKGPFRYRAAEVLELSFVSVPANPEAQVTEKTMPVKKKGLYEVSYLAELMGSLDWLEEMVEWEAGVEQDGSPLPEMLARILQAMGEALIAMTVEEVNEILREEESEVKTKAIGDFRGLVKLAYEAPVAKAGKKLSGATSKALASAVSDHEEAMVMHKAAMDKHCKAIDGLRGLLTDEAPETEAEAEPPVGKTVPTTEHYRRKALLASLG